MPHPTHRVGPDAFATDDSRLQQTVARYDEGKGLIGGDPARRPQWLHPLPLEPAPAFRLLASSDQHLARLQTFLTETPLEIEIGSGRGEFILDWAAQHPDRHFLAFEVKWKLICHIAKSAARRGLSNLWVSDDDARYDLPRLLGPASVDVFHILFPDPWWKPKHQARRLFVPPFVEMLAQLLRPGGLLRIATDVPGYSDHIYNLISSHPTLAFCPSDSESSPATRFAATAPTSRQTFCDHIGRPYRFLYFVKRNPSMPRDIIRTPNAPAAIGPYSQAVRAGNLLFTAGQIGLDPATGQMVAGGVEAQARQVMSNLTAILHAAGGDMNQIVKTTIFLADMGDFAAVNAVYGAAFSDAPPARSTVAVSALPKGALVEIEAIALLD